MQKGNCSMRYPYLPYAVAINPINFAAGNVFKKLNFSILTQEKVNELVTYCLCALLILFIFIAPRMNNVGGILGQYNGIIL
jgi:hypothetical protein